jgi:uncharacterized protein involved in response to NO
MLLGYTMAVIAGFLLTAVRNWTGFPTPTGPLLAVSVLLWLAVRFALASTAVVPTWLAAAIDVSFCLLPEYSCSLYGDREIAATSYSPLSSWR